MEFYVRENGYVDDGETIYYGDPDPNRAPCREAWFDDDRGEWILTVNSIDELVAVASKYGNVMVEPPTDDFEYPTIVLICNEAD